MVRVGLWRSGQCTIYGGRPGRGQAGPLGNPFIVGVHGERGECVELFRKWFASDDPNAVSMRAHVDTHVKPDDILGCFCHELDADWPSCHCDVIAEYVNKKSR